MICFVYRSPYEGLLGKHVRWLPDATVLDWFRRGWTEALSDPDAWVKAELGADVYGLDSIFEEARERSLPSPASMSELRKVLKKHLYVEGAVKVDDHSVRASTDDDEVPLAYFFLDQSLVAAEPARMAYALQEQWPLPSDAPEESDDDPVTTVAVSALGDADWDTQGYVVRLPGVRLPDLPAWLRSADVPKHWPEELTLLRAAVGPHDTGLEPALDRINRWGAWNDQYLDIQGLDGAHEEAHRIVREVMAQVAGHDRIPGPLGRRRPADGRVAVAGHLAQGVFHLDETFGYQQWFVFDDVWAAHHHYLAKSLTRWFKGRWDLL
ncbi:hypothetical protein KZ829_19290 [Actinoplanes hulinensis]|uniref:Uncharacterized protein n=1 Tax=Actinoplanes hulinensis TaxID=1144547 RepID=A0ABS7B522_9ACTN|nr:hypothetical protein [Actinoplanes hulinensis]MBW6435889.1 hypothetical protein [Actinoplanes hulinensis]